MAATSGERFGLQGTGNRLEHLDPVATQGWTVVSQVRFRIRRKNQEASCYRKLEVEGGH